MTSPTTVAGLLADPLLRGARTLAGRAGLARRVTDVTAYRESLGEVAGHLVVCDEARSTPAYRLDALVRRAQEAGAAALCVTATAEKPPLSTVRLADRLEIPVLWLATDDPIDLVIALTLRVRAPEVRRARTLETLVRRLASRTRGADLLTVGRQVLETDLALVTPEGAAVLGEPADLAALRRDLAVPQHVPGLLAHPVHAAGAGAPVAAWLVCPEAAADADRADTLALGLAVLEPFIRSWLAGERTRADHEAAARERLLAQIAADRDTISRATVERAVSLGWRLEDWHVGLHIRCGGTADTVRTRLADEFARQGVTAQVVADGEGGWAAWTSSVRAPGPEDGHALLSAVRAAMGALPEAWRPVAGIGRPAAGPGGLADTLAEARQAARLALSRESRPAVEHADELGVVRLLATWQQSEVTRAFAETALAPLREDPHLLTTLRVFLDHNASATATARALGLHRNTVATRLHHIRTRLNTPLDDPNHRLALHMACHALAPRA
jgi:hypothetical protein